MNHTRRRLLAGVGAIGTASLAGCLGVLTGEEAVGFSASRAVVADATIDSSGYRESQMSSDTVTREFGAAGQTREVEVTNRIAEYDRSLTLLTERIRGALFVVLSTPQVDILGETFNPVGDMSTDELVEMIQDRYDQIGAVSREGSRQTSLLGESHEVVTYRAEGEFLPVELPVTLVELTLHISEPVAVGGDFVVCVGVHPREIDDTDAVDSLLAGVEHTG